MSVMFKLLIVLIFQYRSSMLKNKQKVCSAKESEKLLKNLKTVLYNNFVFPKKTWLNILIIIVVNCFDSKAVDD